MPAWFEEQSDPLWEKSLPRPRCDRHYNREWSRELVDGSYVVMESDLEDSTANSDDSSFIMDPESPDNSTTAGKVTKPVSTSTAMARPEASNL